MVCRSMSLATSQRCGTGLSTRLLISRAQLKALVETILARFLESAPAGGEMEQSLSLTITRSFTPFFQTPASLSASIAIPPVSAPSPITAMAQRSRSPAKWAATAMPSAAEIEVELCAVPKASYSDSERLGNPEIPPSWRSLAMPSLRPVRILCA